MSLIKDGPFAHFDCGEDCTMSALSPMTVRQLIDKLAEKPMDALVILDLADELHSPVGAVRDGKYVPFTRGDIGTFFFAEDIDDATPAVGRVLAVFLQPMYEN